MARNKSDSTIKFLIYMLLFLIFVLLMLVLFIIPTIKSYKTKRSDFHTYNSQNEHLSKKQVDLSKRIAAYKEKNSAVLKSFASEFDKNDFIKFAKKYFTSVTLENGNVKDEKSQFKEYVFKASSHSTSPDNFYKFIEDLENYPAIVKINFPITLISKAKNIELDFNLSIFQSKISDNK